MSTFALLSILVTLAALFGVLSVRVLRLPATLGTTTISLLGSSVLLLAGRYSLPLLHGAQHLERQIDFNAVVLHGLLAFLLFAGALHLDLDQLRRQKLAVVLLSTVSTALSTIFVGVGLHLILKLAQVEIPWLECLLFGALISPTDPIAVLEMLGRVAAPETLKSQLAGESLFNDGIGAVLFLALLSASSSGALPSLGHFTLTVLLQAGGGAGLAMVLGFLTYRLLLLIDDYRIEVLLTLALAMGGYSLADRLHLSMPLEAVTAGLLVNGRIRALSMSPLTRRNVDQFWSLVDDILNAILFLLLGLELLVLPLPFHEIALGLCVIPLVLLSRLLSVSAVVLPLHAFHSQVRGSVTALTWGGLRGALSVALALSLPHGPYRDLLLSITYVVVVASILGQGLSVGPVLRLTGSLPATIGRAARTAG